MMKKGQIAELKKTFSEEDVKTYAELTGDRNPIHLDDSAARQSMFGCRIVHGMLTGGLISAVIGNELPGKGTIYLEQNLRFLKPVFVGDTCKAVVRISEILNDKKGIYKLDTDVINQDGDSVIEGYAVVKYKEMGII